MIGKYIWLVRDFDATNWGDGSETYAYSSLKAIEKDYDNCVWVPDGKDCWYLWTLHDVEWYDDDNKDWDEIVREWEEFGDCPNVRVEKVKVRTGRK